MNIAGALLLLLATAAAARSSTDHQPAMVPPPAVFAFGDSIVDTGNNNGLDTIAKCNFPPYGRDFAGGRPTGRFSNGRVSVDYIASKLGVKELVPAYLAADGHSPEDILTGVSFASGAAGFDPQTASLPNVLSMPDQLNLFAEYKQKLAAVAGKEKAAAIIRDALYVICAGTDDIANTYFLLPIRRRQYNVTDYVNYVAGLATDFVRQLRAMGARRIGFVGAPPIGCLPSQRSLFGGPTRRCSAARNAAAVLFNSVMEAAIGELRREPGFEEAALGYVDIYTVMLSMIERPADYGFRVTALGCCGTGHIEVSVLCTAKAATCPNAEEYMFWDSFHPTERGSKVIVDSVFQQIFPLLS